MATSTATASRGDHDFLLVRHGESQINAAHDPAVRDEGLSYPLTARGIAQAAAMARGLSAHPTALYASTRLRGIQTADAIAFATGVEVQLAPDLVEINFGEILEIVGSGPMVAAVHDLYAEWLLRRTNRRPARGECCDEVCARVLTFLRATVMEGPPGGCSVFVSHGGALLIPAPQLFTNVTPEFAVAHPLPNCGVIHGRRTGGRLICLDWNGITPEARPSPAARES